MAEENIAEVVLGTPDEVVQPGRAKQAKAAGKAFRTLFGRKRKRHHNYPPKPNPFRPPSAPELSHIMPASKPEE